MRKKWGMILGLTGMMLLGAQSIYAAEAADGTAETTDAANEKETAGADDIESKIKKGGFTAGASVHDPSVIKDNDTYYIFGSHMESAKSADLRNWTGFSSGVNAENKLFDNLFDGEEDGDPAAFTYVGKNEEGGYSVWAPDVIYNKKMGKYVMYFCTTSSYVKSNICFATADDIEGPYHYEDTFLYSGYSYHDVKESNIEELMGTDPRPYTAASYDNNNWPNCIDPDVFYDKDGRMWMVYGSWSGGIFLIEIDEETGYPIYPEADEENHVDSYYGKKLLGGYHNSIEGPHIMYDKTSGYYYLFVSYGSLKSDYNIRVGRSRSICGPFIDFHGKDLIADEDEDNSTGLLAMCGYQWNEGQAYMGPEHNSVLHDVNGRWYLVCHIRRKNFTQQEEPSEMQIRESFWSEDGWPFVAAQPLAKTDTGDGIKPVTKEQICGFYERITLAPALPQGITCSVPMKLAPDGYYENCSVQGKWEYTADHRGMIAYGPYTEEVRVYCGWDAQRKCETILLCGLRSDGVAFWAKRIGNLV